MQHDLPLRFSSLGPVRVSTLAVALAVTAGACVSPALAIDRNPEGWSVLEPSVDTRIIFVSSSEGNDHNSGLTPSKPVRTLERAEELVRNGYPDWVLMKRGDTWNEGFNGWSLSGRSDNERVLISAYGEGDARPRVVLQDSSFLVGPMNREVSHLAIVGIAVLGDREPGNSSIGIRWLSNGSDLLLEDCLISGFKDNVVIQAVGEQYQNIELRRNVIVDSWSDSGHSQGIFVKNCNGVLLEENVFDHNGWNEDVPGAEPTTFDQNVYLQTDTFGVVFKGNLTSRAAAAGVQMRTGGDAINNLMYSNGLGLRFGYTALEWPAQSAQGSIIGNVVLGGQLANNTADGAGIGIWVERADNTLVKHNVVADFGTGGVPTAYSLNGFAGDVTYEENIAFNFIDSENRGHAIKSGAEVQGNVKFINNQWHMPGTSRVINLRYSDRFQFVGNDMSGFSGDTDAFFIDGGSIDFQDWIGQGFVTGDSINSSSESTIEGRNLDDYAQHLGLDDADAFIEKARNMSRANWDARYTGGEAARWIRAGYGLGN